MYVKEPSGFSVTEPCAVPLTSVAVSVALSTSVSLPRTFAVSVVSSSSVKASAFATGASLTGLTVRLTPTTFEPSEPSLAL